MKPIEGIYKNGKFEIGVDMAGKIKLLADPCYDILKGCGNFMEMTMKHSTGEEFVFTVQKKGKTTPSHYRKLLEDEVTRLRNELNTHNK